MQILITGATGFIGQYLVREAYSRGMSVFAGIRESSSKDSIDPYVVGYVPFDMDKPAQFEPDLAHAVEQTGGFDFVVHNAGVTNPKRIEEFSQGNATIAAAFAAAAVQTQQCLRKFIYMSSMAAVGPGDPVSLNPITETQRANPITPYGKSKHLGEQMLKAIDGLHLVILRPSAVYGKNDPKFLDRLVGMISKGVAVRLGSDRQLASFVHAADLATLCLNACTTNRAGEAYNVSDGRTYSQKVLYDLLLELMQKKAVSLRIPSSVLINGAFAYFKLMGLLGQQVHLSHHKMRELTALNWSVDISKAQQQLGFNPEFDLRRGLEDVLHKGAPGSETRGLR